MTEIIIPKRYIHLSPSSLDDAQKCLTNFRNRLYNLNEKPEYLTRGSIMHRLLEHFYKSRAVGASPDESREKAEQAVRQESLADNDIDVELNEHIISVFGMYVEHEINGDWIIESPEDVECTGSIVLLDTGELQILFEYIMDLQITLPSQPKTKFVIDHKTASSGRQPTLRTNQFLGISYGQESEMLFVNQINVQKSKPRAGDASRFNLYTASFAESVLNEWRSNTIASVFDILQAETTGFWKQSNSQCWNCIYREICNEPPDIREELLRQRFVLREKRDLYIEKSGDSE